MKSKWILTGYLATMGVMVVYGAFHPDFFVDVMQRPGLYLHAKFFHILAVTLFFAQVVIGTVWETRSLLSGRADIIRYTYDTVVWLDAILTAPLILVSVVTGIMLGTALGGVWNIGWVSLAFLIFLASGLLWLFADIPMQYRVKKYFRAVDRDATALPPALRRLLFWRMGVNLAGVLPLLVIFFLMVHKPSLPKLSAWIQKHVAPASAAPDSGSVSVSK